MNSWSPQPLAPRSSKTGTSAPGKKNKCKKEHAESHTTDAGQEETKSFCDAEAPDASTALETIATASTSVTAESSSVPEAPWTTNAAATPSSPAAEDKETFTATVPVPPDVPLEDVFVSVDSDAVVDDGGVVDDGFVAVDAPADAEIADAAAAVESSVAAAAVATPTGGDDGEVVVKNTSDTAVDASMVKEEDVRAPQVEELIATDAEPGDEWILDVGIFGATVFADTVFSEIVRWAYVKYFCWRCCSLLFLLLGSLVRMSCAVEAPRRNATNEYSSCVIDPFWTRGRSA